MLPAFTVSVEKLVWIVGKCFLHRNFLVQAKSKVTAVRNGRVNCYTQYFYTLFTISILCLKKGAPNSVKS